MKLPLDKDGYHRVWLGEVDGVKCYDVKHRMVWREHYGEIPPRKHVHHKDGDKLNNHINNLELIDPTPHARMHRREMVGGYSVIDGVDHKICRQCLKTFPIDSFYKKPSGKHGNVSHHSYCKPCYNERVIERRRRKCLP
jgi:hypothetical protein